MWAFALLSPQQRELILCRDRFGIKPLYYTFVGDWLLFASEIRALFASGLVKKAWAKGSVEYYLAYGVPIAGGKLTFYSGIYQVPPATVLRCHGGEVVEEVYYSIPKQQAMPLRELLEAAGSTFMDAVRIALRSDAPLALSLSGGIDSTNIATAAARWLKRQRQVTAYTLDTSPMYESEVEFARDVAIRNNLQLKVVSLPTQLTLQEIANFVLTNEEPIGSPGNIVQYFLYNQIARDGIRVILDGQGGDEAFAGYPWLYYPILCQIVRQHRYRELLSWLIGIVRNGNMNPLMIWLAGRQFLNPYLRYDPEAVSLLRSGRPLLPHCNYILRTASSARTWRERQWVAYYQWELPSLFRDADRNGMRWSLEIHSPFLDHRLAELTHNADPLDLTHNGWSKYVARAMLEDDHIPPHIRWFRRKRGFYIQPNAFAAVLEGVIPLLLPFIQELPEIIDISHLQKKLVDKVLHPHLVWRIFLLVLLDISSDLTKLSPEAMVIIRETPDFVLGRRPKKSFGSIKGAVWLARKWLWSETKWLTDRKVDTQ